MIYANTFEGQLINNLDHWGQVAGPVGGLAYWQDYRSAKELARSWFREGFVAMPQEYEELLNSHASTRGFVFSEACAEMKIPIDAFRSPRNCDLVVRDAALSGQTERKIVLSVEAKADEPFAKTIEQELGNLPVDSDKPLRIAQLTDAVLQRTVDELVMPLRYQLLHSLAATAVAARLSGSKVGVLLIHEFVSLALDIEAITRNSNDLASFIRLVPGWEGESLRVGRLLPPIRLRGNHYIPNDVLVTVGKVRTLIPLGSGGRLPVAHGFNTNTRQYLAD